MLMKRVTSTVLVCVMLLSLLPVPVRADDESLPQEGGELFVQTNDESPQPPDDALPQEDEGPARQEDEDDTARPETLESEDEDLPEQTEEPLPREDVIPLLRIGGLSLMQSGALPLMQADGNSAAQESEPVRIEAKDGSFALEPTSDGSYCLRIYMDPVFDDLLETVEPYSDNVTAAYIGAEVNYLDDSGRNSFSDFSHLAAFEVDPDNKSYTTIDGVLFKLNSSGTTQLMYYPPAKTDPFTLPDSTVWIDGAAFNNVPQAIINVPVGLELPSDSPISIESLQEISGVEVSILHTSDVESVVIRFQDDTISSLPVLDAGDTRSLSALVEPAGALPGVTWSSSNDAVATVDSDGKVTAVGKGSADIIATTVGLKGTEHLSASCAVEVRPRVTDVTIASEDGRAALIPDETLTLSASVAPADANPGLIWSVSDPGVLSLSSDTGSSVTVTALSAGTATVTAASVKYSAMVDTYEITVSVPVTGVTLNTGDFTLYLTNPVSETKQLTATAHPENATNPRVSWSSSDTAVATVSPTGLVSAVSKGSATITAVSEDNGEAASCVVSVQEVYVSGLAIAPAALNLRIDPTLPTAKYGQLSVSLDPVDATWQDVAWASLAPEIAVVDQNGKVTAVGGGDAIIIATSTHGADGALVTAQRKVTVEVGAASISIPEALALSLNKESADSQATLTATVEPANSTDALNWASSNESVATVDADGKVIAVSEGSATITVTCGSVKAVCAVTVTDYQVKKFDTLPQNVRVKVSKTGTISAKLGPDHATDKEIVWTIDNGEIASLSEPAVTADGTSTVTVEGLKVGTATVTATSADNDSIVAVCTVTVPEVKVESLQLNPKTLTLYRNTPDGKTAEFPSTAVLTLTISPADTTNDVVWTNSNSGTVTLGSAQYETANHVKTGAVTLTAANGGTSVITAAADGQTAPCTVTVVVLAADVTISKSELALVKGTSAALIAAVLPEDVDNSAVTWTSSNNNVATVDANGVVTAVAASGTATITATAKDGSGVQAACTVTAKPVPASGITLDAASITLEKGESKELSATVTPASVTNGSVTWASADETIAKVDADGKVTAVNGGVTTITAATADGKFRANCEVTVTVTPTGLTLDRGTLTIRRAENSANTGTLTATVTPADTTVGSVVWVSSDSGTVAVESSSAIDKSTGAAGVTLMGKKAGSAVITARIGGLIRTCTVTVEQPAAGITLDRTSLSLGLHKSDVPGSDTLRATLDPADSTDPLAWSSNNESVATVDQNGVVTAVSAGSATITATCGSAKAVCAVTVTDYRIKALRTESELTVYLGGGETKLSEKTLTLAIEPFDTQDSVTWSNGNPDAVTLGAPNESSGEGSKTQTVTVTAKSAGKAVITAAAANGITARCTVTVVDLSVKSVSVTPRRLVLQEGGVSDALLAVIEPSAAAITDVTWRSSNNNVATVSDGVVTAVGVGEAEIIVTTADGGKSDVCYVTVAPKPVEHITLSEPSIDIFFRETEKRSQTLTATVTPDNATDMRVIWTSSNESVATVVGNNGGTATVTLRAAGDAVITATSASNSAVSAVCPVTVRATRVVSIRLDKSSLELNPLETDTLAATLTSDCDGYEPDNKTIAWTSSNENVAAVDSFGKVSAVGAGTAVITACTEDGGFVAACVVRVWQKVSGVSLDATSLHLNVGEAGKLNAMVKPSNAANKTVTWSSSNSSVAAVDAAGNITALAAGEATITAATEDQNQAATCNVTVSSVAVGSVTLSETALTLLVNDVRTLAATVSPDNATDTSVSWESDKPAVVSVVDGTITANAAGTATITATAGSKSADCEITVYAAVTGVSISGDGTLTLDVGANQTLTAAVAPTSEADSRVIWSSSDTSVAAVGDDGKVTAVAPGIAVITAASVASPVKQAFRTVKVVQPANGVTLSASTLTFDLSIENKSAELTATITPSNTTDPVTWTIVGNSVAQISAPVVVNGGSSVTVYALKAGTATVTAACGNQTKSCTVTVTNPATGVTLDAAALTLTPGGTHAFTATVFPANATDKTVSWSSSNSSIVSVVDGTITAKAVGQATITAVANGHTTTCVVTVAPILVSSVSMESSLALTPDASQQLTASVLPENAASKTLNWASSDIRVATVTSDGTVHAIKPGTAIITATAADGSGKSAFSVVTVSPIAVTALAFSHEGTLTLAKNERQQLSVTITPDTATDKTLRWHSSNETVATVDETGSVTAVGSGTAIITATSADGGKTAACTVTVAKGVTGVSITEAAPSFDLNMGSTLTLHAAVESDGTADEAVTWSSSNPAVAAVSAHGVVTPIAPGTTSIEAATADGDYFDSRSVTVKQLAAGITLTPAVLSLPVGRTAELTAALLGNPTNPSVNWSVSGTAVRVSDNGAVTAEEAGTATVTAAAVDGSGASKSCVVTVYEPVTAVALKKDGSAVSSLTLTMVTDPSAQLSAETTGGSSVTVVWSSSNENVATVNASGLVSAVGAGTATVTVTATTGDVSASKSCTVTVRKAVISADTTSMTLTPARNATNVVFSPWAAGTSLTWSVSGSGVTRTEGALNGSGKTYTISSLNNGVTTIFWSKAEDARYEASSGEITVFSVYDPITAVSIDRSKLTAGCALTASVDQANRTIRVAGYVSGDAGAYSLDGKLIFTPAGGVIDGLSVVYSTDAVTARLNGNVICTYALDRTGIVSLPDNVNVKTTLVAEENAAVSSVSLTNANISGVAAAVSAAKTAAGDKLAGTDETDVTVAVTLSPVSQRGGSVAGYNTVTLDITPQYTITSQQDGALIDSGTLSELPAAITIEVETAFRPTLIVHKHNDSVEYITPLCSGPNANGLYTVSWQQRTFSEVELLDEAAAQQYLAEQAKANEPAKLTAGGGITSGSGAGAPAAAEGAKTAPAETAPTTFADVSPSHWAADAIAYVSAHGIMNGMGDGSFAPEAAASRAMIAQILFRLAPGKAVGTQGFADAAGTWYDEAARWAASCGIVTGIGGSFRGGDAITREQLVTMLYRCAQFMGRDVSTEAADYDRFTDAASVSPWASGAMRWAVGCGLIQGIGNALSPGTGATRAQIAAIMMRFCESAAV